MAVDPYSLLELSTDEVRLMQRIREADRQGRRLHVSDLTPAELETRRALGRKELVTTARDSGGLILTPKGIHALQLALDRAEREERERQESDRRRKRDVRLSWLQLLVSLLGAFGLGLLSGMLLK